MGVEDEVMKVDRYLEVLWVVLVLGEVVIFEGVGYFDLFDWDEVLEVLLEVLE